MCVCVTKQCKWCLPADLVTTLVCFSFPPRECAPVYLILNNCAIICVNNASVQKLFSRAVAKQLLHIAVWQPVQKWSQRGVNLCVTTFRLNIEKFIWPSKTIRTLRFLSTGRQCRFGRKQNPSQQLRMEIRSKFSLSEQIHESLEINPHQLGFVVRVHTWVFGNVWWAVKSSREFFH